MKRLLPIFVLLALVTGLAACQPDVAEKVTVSVAEKLGAQVAPPAGDEEHAAAESQEAGHEDSGTEEHGLSHDDSAVGEHDTPEFVPPKPVTLDSSPEAVAFAMGDPDAPVQVIEFTDYQCPFCSRYASETLPVMIENLIESGRVYYAIKDLPLDAIHSKARLASVAARCAGEQDAYLPMHDAIFATQAEWQGTGDDAQAIFSDLAAELELDSEALMSCMTGGDQAERVQANVDEAQSLGVNGTPFFFIDGYGVSGAQPYEMFEMAIELAESDQLDDAVEAQARQVYEAMAAQQAVAQQAAGQQAAAQPAEPVEISLDNAFAIGDPSAPVTIVEYTDYQCPFCARHALNTFSQITDELIESGQVRYVFKDLPLTTLHPQAMLAAEATRCAGDQDQETFVAMHDLLFENQGSWSGQTNAAELFTGYATEIGLDSDRFETCLEDRDFEAAVQADILEASELGFSGTPAFLINGQPMMGAQPFELFEQAVESLVAEGPVKSASN